MKTFETEKHNIPEGATHYFDETSEEHFTWWDDNKQMLLGPENANEWVRPNEFDDVSNPVEIKKPRTKTEFVKCEFECAWHAIKAFEDGDELYTKRSHKDFVLIDNAPDVLRFLYDLHRKVETEIDEHQEFIGTYNELRREFKLQHKVENFHNFLFDSGKFKLVE